MRSVTPEDRLLQLDRGALQEALSRERIRPSRMGRLIGVCETYGRQIAAGRVPSAAVRDKIAALLKVKPEELWKPAGAPTAGEEAME